MESGAVDVPEGHMLGRKPNGYDTNQANDFVDLAVPGASKSRSKVELEMVDLLV